MNERVNAKSDRVSGQMNQRLTWHGIISRGEYEIVIFDDENRI